MIQKRRVVITGMDLITSIGVGLKNNWMALIENKTGLRSLRDMPEMLKYKCQVGATLHPDFDHKQFKTTFGNVSYFNLAEALARGALKDANIDTKNMSIDRNRFGVYIGSLNASINEVINQEDSVSTGESATQMPFMLPCSISFNHNLHGQSSVASNACAAGTIAMGDSFRMIQHGLMDAMLVGGVDQNVNPFGFKLMERIGALRLDSNENPDQAVRPFDSKRNGACLADGGAIFVIENLESALARGAKIYCEIAGFGSSCIGKHICTPIESGIGSYLSMSRALIDAEMTPSQMDFVNTHATSTKIGDSAEAVGFKSLFHNSKTFDNIENLKIYDAYNIQSKDLFSNPTSGVPITALKGNFGHCQAASGAIETAASILSMENNTLTPIRNLSDPADKTLNFVQNALQKKQINAFMKSSVGFGSQYAALVFKRYPQLKD